MASPLAECDELFAAIRAAKEPRTIQDLLTELLFDYQFMSMKLGRGSVFWRGRRVTKGTFDNTSQLGYPPADLTPVGRLNSKGAPVLYASTREETVLHEIGASAGDEIQFMGFRVKENKSLHLVTIGEFFHVYRTGYLRTLGRDPENAISKILNSLGRERGHRMVYIDAFLASLLVDPAAEGDNYLYTRILGQLALERSKADGYSYPSVQAGLGMNLAILPAVLDDVISPVRSYVARVLQHRAFGGIEYEILCEAENMDDEGRLTWRTTSAPNIAGFFGVTQRESEFLANQPKIDGNAFLALKKLYTSDD